MYICLTENGKQRKTDTVTYALCFDDLNSAITYMKKTPAKTKGYYNPAQPAQQDEINKVRSEVAM